MVPDAVAQRSINLGPQSWSHGDCRVVDGARFHEVVFIAFVYLLAMYKHLVHEPRYCGRFAHTQREVKGLSLGLDERVRWKPLLQDCEQIIEGVVEGQDVDARHVRAAMNLLSWCVYMRARLPADRHPFGMDALKNQILLLTHEQQTHIHAIIGDGGCVKTATGVRFNLRKLDPDVIHNIRDYIGAVMKESKPAVGLELLVETVPHGQKKMVLTKHQSMVKKRLKIKCRQRKAPKQDKTSSRIDVAVASEFYDALKTDGDDYDGGEASIGVVDDVHDDDYEIPEVDVEAEEPEDAVDDATEGVEDGQSAVLPAHLSQHPLHVLYKHYHQYLREKGIVC